MTSRFVRDFVAGFVSSPEMFQKYTIQLNTWDNITNPHFLKLKSIKISRDPPGRTKEAGTKLRQISLSTYYRRRDDLPLASRPLACIFVMKVKAFQDGENLSGHQLAPHPLLVKTNLSRLRLHPTRTSSDSFEINALPRNERKNILSSLRNSE